MFDDEKIKIADRAYEAAVVPELWPHLCDLLSSHIGALRICRKQRPKPQVFFTFTSPSSRPAIASLSALGFITIGIPVLTYLARNDPTVDTVGLGFVALGPLGWYISSSFSEAYARKTACNSQSFFGIGCTLDGEPMLSFFVFSIIAVCVAVAAGIMLLGFVLKAFND